MWEVTTMHNHKEAQEGRVDLNIGGYRFETSVQALRRVPHTFFDAYFSGRYAQDVCNDGSIFVDRDGEHFGHVLEYMRDGVVSVAEPGAHPSVSLLRALKREFGFYCIELGAEQPVAPEQPEVGLVMGGQDCRTAECNSSMERYDVSTGQWTATAAMATARSYLGACVIAGELYVSGGYSNTDRLSSVEKYSPSSDAWIAVVHLPVARASHAAVAVGLAMYVLGGVTDTFTASVLKFDSTEGTYREVSPMPEVRCGFASCAVECDIYVFGGCDNLHSDKPSAFKYDTVADAWSTLTPMPHCCAFVSANVIDGLIYIVGVGDDNDHSDKVLRFDPASGTYATLAPTTRIRRCGASFVLAGCLYAAGGSNTRTSESVERYDVASNTWTVVANMLEGRESTRAVTIGSASLAEVQDLFDALIAKAAS
jgi:hypothetical protein